MIQFWNFGIPLYLGKGETKRFKFGTPMQNRIPKTISRLKSKPDVRFQKSEVVVTTPWKFGVQIDLDIAKRVNSLKPKPGLDFRLYGRHLEKSI